MAILHNSTISKAFMKCLKENSYKDCRNVNIFDIYGDIMLIWNKEEGCISYGIYQDLQKDREIQKFVLSKPPLWDVQKISVNAEGTGLLIICKRGVGIVELPHRWSYLLNIDGQKSTVTCRVEYLGKKLFASSPDMQVISAKWHPGASSDLSVAVLSSDNYLRTYNINSSEIPEYYLIVAPSSNLKTSHISHQQILGDKPVAFDFGPPVETFLQDADTITKISEENKMKAKFGKTNWPVFILYENGNVYYTILTLSWKRSMQKVLYGPMKMTPQSLDNYGLESCDLLVLASTPPLLVIADSSGKLHHCVVTNANGDENEEESGLNKSMFAGTQINLLLPSLALHVYETLELELSEKDCSLSLSLHSDPYTASRYFVSHIVGVHSVVVPLVEKLIQFVNLPDDLQFENTNDDESSITYMVSTNFAGSSSFLSIIGLCTTPLPSSLLVLLESGNILKFVLSPVYIPSVSEYFSEASKSIVKRDSSDFENHIRKILRRAASQPLLVSKQSGSYSASESFTLFNKGIETLRTHYILPQAQAKEEIEWRIEILKSQKQNLKKDIEGIEKEKELLRDSAQRIAEKYEESSEFKVKLTRKLEAVLHSMVQSEPVMSSNEKAMLKELNEFEEKLPSLETNLQQVKAKQAWQFSQIEKHKTNESIKAQSLNLSINQLKSLKDSLSKESERLSVLVKKVKRAKKELLL